MDRPIDTKQVNSLASRPSTVEDRAHAISFAILVALASLSIHGFWRGVLPLAESWMPGLQLSVLGMLWASTYLVPSFRTLRGFVLVNLTLHTSTWLIFTVFAQGERWSGWVGGTSLLWQQQGGEIILKAMQMLVMIAVLWSMGLQRADFFLVRGQMDAAVEPVRWLGIKPGTNWRHFGTRFALSGMLIFAGVLVLGLRPALSLGTVGQFFPLLPTVLLFAALNALYEEVVFKAAPLSQLEPTVGKHLALALTAVLFGLGHYTESYFLPGMSVLLPTFLGYVLGKSMLETRGLAWAWLIHLGMDVVLFSLLALATVTGIRV